MILYLDGSALVKRYLDEPGARDVRVAVSDAEVTGTSLISRAEIAASLAEAVRMDALTRDEAWACLRAFRDDWPDLVRIKITDVIAARAGSFAWEHGLQGNAAVHLAAASVWQEVMGEEMVVSTFDRRLWTAVEHLGMEAHPRDLPALLDTWRQSH